MTAGVGKLQRSLPAQATELQQAADSRLFQTLYRDHFDFIFRNLCRLGVPRAQAEDALQDVYIVVLRRLADFQPGTSERAWLFAIAVRVASDYRRSQRRKGTDPWPEADLPASRAEDPFEGAARGEAVARLHACLGQLDDDKRAVFVMTELEQMSAPEIAAALQLNLNTVYTRLRAARQAFARAAAQTGEPGDG